MIAQLMSQHRTAIRQFIKFVITGTLGAVVDFGTYNILTRILDWQSVYEIFGAKIIAANLVSVLLAIMSNFILNKYWTFRDRSEKIAGQGGSYFAFNLITFVFNQLLTSFFIFHVPVFAIFGSQKDNAAKAMAIGLILFINFLGSKFLIFGNDQTKARI